MPTFGTLKKTYPIIEVIRGWNPNEPQTRTAAYPVGTDNTGATLVIYSGMLITPVWSSTNARMEWTIADKDTSNIKTAPIYLAQDSYSKEDIIEAGNLVGLSCAGQFEVESAFYTASQTYNEGDYLTVGDDGKVTPVAQASYDGTQVIVGQVTRAPGNGSASATLRSLVGINSGVVNTNVITFNTMYIPANDA